MKINIRCFMFILCMYITVFQVPLQDSIPIFRYFDEFLALLIIPITLVNMVNKKRIKLTREEQFIIVIYFIINIVGIISSLIYKYQKFNVVIIDILAVNKFVSIYFVSKYLFSKIGQQDLLIKKIQFHCKIITIILLVITILDYAIGLFSINYATRYFLGIKSIQLFYGFSAYLATAVAFLLLTLMFVTNENTYKKNKKYFIICYILLILTMRSKTLIYCAVSLGLMYYIIKKNKRVSFNKMVILGLIVFLLAYNQISFYFIENTDTARLNLLTTSMKISGDYFPIGCGFATFGSQASADNYSPVYYMYGLNKIYGLAEGATYFLTDSFWPVALGQFGITGGICYIIYMILIVNQAQKLKNNKYRYNVAIQISIYIMLSSISENVLTTSVGLAILMGILFNNSEKC